MMGGGGASIFTGGGEDEVETSITSQDRLAFTLCGDDKSRFRAVKKQNIEDVYKQIYLLNEENDRQNQAAGKQAPGIRQ